MASPRSFARKIRKLLTRGRRPAWGNPQADRSTKGLKRRWNNRYRIKDLTQVNWYDENQKQLVELIESGSVPEGPALDLGCGPGVATVLLAENRLTVGLDIAQTVIPRARSRAADRRVRPMWVVGAAPALPFRASAFGFVFERGTMHQLPVEVYGAHLAEITRILRLGGLAQILEGVNACGRLPEICPPDIEIERFETFDLPLRDGSRRPMIHALLRRVESPCADQSTPSLAE